MELTFIKNYLRIDTDADDANIQLMYEATKEYIVDAVGVCDESKARVKLLILNIMASLYEQRCFTVDKSNEKVAYTLKSMLTQLALDEVV